MRIGLRDDREITVELSMKTTKGYILTENQLISAPGPAQNSPKTTVLESGTTEIVRLDLTISVFCHQDHLRHELDSRIRQRPAYWVENTWYCSTRDDSRPDDAVWCSQMIKQDSRPEYQSGGYLNHGTNAYECRSLGTTETFRARPVRSYASLKVRDPFVKNMAYMINILSYKISLSHLFCPFDSGESSSSLIPPLDPYTEGVFTGGNLVGQLWHQQVLELLIRSCAA